MAGFRPMNLAGIRDRIFAESDFAPSKSEEGKRRADEFINRAYYQLLLDAPYLFFVGHFEVGIYPDVRSTDTIKLATFPSSADKDAWVLEVTPDATSTVEYNTLGLWNGRRLFLNIPSEERWVERTIREVWQDAETYYLSIDQPLHTDEDITEWLVELGAYTLPHELVSIKHIADLDTGITRQIEIVPEGVAEQGTLEPSLITRTTGNITTAYRRNVRSLRAPTFTPVATEDTGDNWLGPEPTGTFEYCYTYAWGYQDVDERMKGPATQAQAFASADTTRSTPFLESPPSEVTSQVAQTGSFAIDLSLPDIDFVLGFGDSSTRRYNHSGIKKRIYRRRVATSTLGFGRNVEVPNHFYLVDEVDGDVQEWTDDGSKTPDYSRPLQSAHGYQTLQFYPRPAEKRTLKVRAAYRPTPLQDDNDFPVVDEAAVEALITKALTFAHNARGDYGAMDTAERRYQGDLKQLAKSYGTAVPGGQPIRIGGMRSRRRERSNPRWMYSRSTT